MVTFLTKVIVDIPLCSSCIYIQKSAIWKYKIIRSVPIEIPHQSFRMTPVFTVKHHLWYQKSHAQADFKNNSFNKNMEEFESQQKNVCPSL